jgi:putative membrane protein
MKKFLFTILAASIMGTFAVQASAQMLGGFSNSGADWERIVAHTAEEEQEGKEVWDKLQAKQVECANLSDDEFGVLGEYFMGQTTGTSHATMNAMLIQRHGEEGEEQIHIALGKELSGCDTSRDVTRISGGWMPMMMGGWSSPIGFNQQLNNNSMMGYGFPFLGGFGWIFMVLFWGLVIWGAVALVRGGFGNGHNHGASHEKTPLDILKERYARGEINKEEFESKKKDMT